LVAQAIIFRFFGGIRVRFSRSSHGNAKLMRDDNERKHKDEESKDELEGVH
jgi:hypothetical protein